MSSNPSSLMFMGSGPKAGWALLLHCVMDQSRTYQCYQSNQTGKAFVVPVCVRGQALTPWHILMQGMHLCTPSLVAFV